MRIMKSHIEVGRRYPEISINTSYSFGLDDQEFVVAFEGDDPGEFLDLVQELRPTESSAYTERETPIFTCVAMSARKALDALDGTAAVAADAPPSASRSAPRRREVPCSLFFPARCIPTPAHGTRQMTQIGTPESPVRVAIVGAGPSGFYAAEHILKDEDTHAQVDLFDRLPTPFGLVRGGVAPDHPKIKSVIRVYEKTAAREGFRFFGNVKVGHDIEVEDLERLYHAIVFTVGCETDRQLGIPGEDLPGSHAATAFVGWYNAHPDYCRRGVRPLLRAGGRDRQRQRGDGRRPHARAHRPRAAPDRHRRPRDRAARREARSARSSSSAAAGRPRPPSPTRRSRSSARWRTPT